MYILYRQWWYIPGQMQEQVQRVVGCRERVARGKLSWRFWFVKGLQMNGTWDYLVWYVIMEEGLETGNAVLPVTPSGMSSTFCRALLHQL